MMTERVWRKECLSKDREVGKHLTHFRSTQGNVNGNLGVKRRVGWDEEGRRWLVPAGKKKEQKRRLGLGRQERVPPLLLFECGQGRPWHETTRGCSLQGFSPGVFSSVCTLGPKLFLFEFPSTFRGQKKGSHSLD